MLAQRHATKAAASLPIPFKTGIDGKRRDHSVIGSLRQSAAAGDADAQYRLGLAYLKGCNSAEDMSEGARWLQRAANQGHIGGQLNTGVAYALGTGVLQDAVAAHMWFNLAAAKGNERARENRVKIVRKMSREQVAEAQRLARYWKPELSYWTDPQL